MDAAAPVVCRPNREGLGLALSWLLCTAMVGVIPLLAPKRLAGTELLLIAGSVAAFGIPGLVTLWWVARARVEAGERGLRWRGMGSWRRARWEEVRDYYLKSGDPTRGIQGRGPFLVVDTPAGQLRVNVPLHSGTEELKEAVRQRARQARTQEWGIHGARLEIDGSRTFTYPPLGLGIDVLGSFVALGAGCLGAAAWIVVRSASVIGEIGWPLGAAAMASALLLVLCPWGLIFMALPFFRGAYRRRQQSLLATPEGLTLLDGPRRIFLAWEDVTDYSCDGQGPSPGRYPRRVVSGRGARIEFLHTLRDAAVLCEIVRTCSTNTAGRPWAVRDGETLGGETLKWSGGARGAGQRVYHYRTRTNRAMLLWLPLAFAATGLLMAGLAAAGLTAPETAQVGFFTAGVSGVGTLFAGWWYTRASVRTDGLGITAEGPFGSRTLPWKAIDSYRLDGSSLELRAGRRKLRISALVSDVEELQAEIARRVVNAGGCSWEGNGPRLKVEG